MKPEDVLDFWAGVGKKGWWVKKPEIDQSIHDRFYETHSLAHEGKLDHWTQTADGTLALIIVLDQFSRNLFRNSPKAFAQDAQALAIAKAAIAEGFDNQCRKDLRLFFYLPFEHSENLSDQILSVQYISKILPTNELHAVHEHHEIIERFGRFPHRNGVLGRETTPEEQAYLDGGGFRG